MNLKKISDNFYLSKYATSDSASSIINKLKSLDVSKYEISESSKNFLIGTVDRKVSNELKANILRLVSNGTIIIVSCGKETGFPNFLLSTPMAIGGEVKYIANIGYYAKMSSNKKGEVLDIEPRVLFTILTNAYALYKMVSSTSKILNDIKMQENVILSYRKLISRIIGKAISLNSLTNEEKLAYDCNVSIFAAKRMLLKDNKSAITFTKNHLTKASTNKDRLETQLNMIEVDNIEDLEDLVASLKKISPSFSKINSSLIIKEWAISFKMCSVLTIDLIQFYIAMLLSVSVGSYGIFNDKTLESILDSKEIDNIKLAILRN